MNNLPENNYQTKESSDTTYEKQEVIPLPCYFLGHASPAILIDYKTTYAKFLRETLPKQMKDIKGIVIFSAHWDSEVQQISYRENYELIYDFGDDPYPDECYKSLYPAIGDLNLAKEIAVLFEENGIITNFDSIRGLDHASWILPKLIFPEAKIPIVQLSVNSKKDPFEQYKTGKALSSLREKGILIIGSGGIVHNLGLMQPTYQGEDGETWAQEFDAWVETQLQTWNLKDLFNYHEKAPHSRDAVPTPEHFIPLLIAMGAGDKNKKCDVLHRSYAEKNLSLSAYKFF